VPLASATLTGADGPSPTGQLKRLFAPSIAIELHTGSTLSTFPPLFINREVETSQLPRKQNLARYLRDARIKRRLSVAAVAEQIGVSQVSIYYWDTDHCRPRAENLSALCKVLKLPVRATREMAAG
jgi:DNA-binding XRE family transcriptional regulator